MNNPQRLLLVLLLVLPTACFSFDDLAQDPPSKSQYLLAATPKVDASGKALGAVEATAGTAAATTGPLLLVHKAYVAAPFHEKAFVYRTGANRYTSDYYQEFLVSPSQMVTQLAIDWLQRAQAFPQVHHGSQAAMPDYSLDLNLLELYGDYRKAGMQAAIVRLKAVLWAHDNEDATQKAVLQKEYAAQVSVADREGPTLVAGFNKGLEQVLADLAKDLRAQRK